MCTILYIYINNTDSNVNTSHMYIQRINAQFLPLTMSVRTYLNDMDDKRNLIRGHRSSLGILTGIIK